MTTNQNLEKLNIELIMTSETFNSEEGSTDKFFDIYFEGEKAGEIGFSIYDDINALGLGSFEVDKNKRGKGIGTAVIKYIIDQYKNKYDLIYCYVDKDNYNAINLYSKLGKVYDELTSNDQYFVTFVDKRNMNEDFALTDLLAPNTIAIDETSKLISESLLTEETRTQLVNASKNAGLYKNKSKGKNRFERKRYSKIANQVKSYNRIDMNKLFKDDILEVDIPVVGETNTYTVTLKLNKVVDELRKNIINNNNKLEYKCVIQAITKIFNTSDVYVKCECQDFKYRFAHWSIINNYSVDDTSKDPGLGKGIANPNDDMGKGCKHILVVLSNLAWINNVSSVIKNYIFYIAEKQQQLFRKIIFPKLYGVNVENAVEEDLISDDLDITKNNINLLDEVNKWAKDRGKFTKGSNKNPAKGKGSLEIK